MLRAMEADYRACLESEVRGQVVSVSTLHFFEGRKRLSRQRYPHVPLVHATRRSRFQRGGGFSFVQIHYCCGRSGSCMLRFDVRCSIGSNNWCLSLVRKTQLTSNSWVTRQAAVSFTLNSALAWSHFGFFFIAFFGRHHGARRVDGSLIYCTYTRPKISSSRDQSSLVSSTTHDIPQINCVSRTRY